MVPAKFTWNANLLDRNELTKITRPTNSPKFPNQLVSSWENKFRIAIQFNQSVPYHLKKADQAKLVYIPASKKEYLLKCIGKYGEWTFWSMNGFWLFKAYWTPWSTTCFATQKTFQWKLITPRFAAFLFWRNYILGTWIYLGKKGRWNHPETFKQLSELWLEFFPARKRQ